MARKAQENKIKKLLNNNCSNWRVFLLLTLFTVIIRLPDIDMPLERDEGEYAFAAQQILRGEMPYIDSFCQKPPMIFFWYIAGYKMFGETVRGIHLIMFLAAALSAFGLYLLVLELLRQERVDHHGSLLARGAALVSAVIFGMASAGTAYFGPAANTEIFMLVPVLFGIWFLLKTRVSATNFIWFMFGLCLAAAVMTKQVAIFSFIGPLILVAYQLFQWKRIRPTGVFVCLGGMAAIVLPIIGWLWLREALQDFVQVSLRHNIGYIGFPFGISKWQQILLVIGERFMINIVLWINVFVLIIAVAFNKPLRNIANSWFGIIWFSFSVFGVALGPYAFGHYFLQVLPPLCLITGTLLDHIVTKSMLPKYSRYGIAGFVLITLIVPMSYERIASLQMNSRELSFRLYSPYGPSPFAAAQEVGYFVRQNSTPEDRILIVGSEPEVLFYANRKSATRYTIFYPLTGPYDQADEMIDELFDEIKRYPPKMILLVFCRTSFISGTGRLQLIFSKMHSILQRGYSEVDMVGTDSKGSVFWKNRTPTPLGNVIPLFQIFVAK